MVIRIKNETSLSTENTEMSSLVDQEAKTWGPIYWSMIDTIVSSYPDLPSESLQTSTSLFLESLKDLLPCDRCRQHYVNHMKENPIAISSKEDLLRWVTCMKNAVQPPIQGQQQPKQKPNSITNNIRTHQQRIMQQRALTMRKAIHTTRSAKPRAETQSITTAKPRGAARKATKANTAQSTRRAARSLVQATKRDCNCGGRR